MWRGLIVVAVLAAGATRVTAANLPIVAHTGAAGAMVGPSLPDRDAAFAALSLVGPDPVPSASRVHLRGQKYVGRQLQRSEAGLTWSLSPKVTLELNYERSALAPMMPHDHDNGILTRLKLGF